MLQRCSSTLPKRSIVNPYAAVHYVRSQEGPQDAELAFFEILKFSEIAANTGGQAAMVEDRLGRMSQLDFESITLSSGVQCTAKKSELDRRTETAHKLLLQSGGKQQW